MPPVGGITNGTFFNKGSDNMDLKLQAKQTQVLSQRMIQSAEILQMTSQELNTYISDLALENPVIDLSLIHI